MRPEFSQAYGINHGVKRYVPNCGTHRWICPHCHRTEVSEIVKYTNRVVNDMYAQTSLKRHVLKESVIPGIFNSRSYFDGYYQAYLYEEPRW